MKPYKHHLEYYCLDDIRGALKEKCGKDIYAWVEGVSCYNLEKWYEEELYDLDTILLCGEFLTLDREFLYVNCFYFPSVIKNIFSLIIKEYGDENGRIVIKMRRKI